jgi:beta-galactosidase
MKWNWPTNSQLTVRAVANCDEAELFLNNHSLGRHAIALDAYASDWMVKYEPGLLAAVGYRAGKPVATNALVTTGEPVRLKITPLESPMSTGTSLYQITVVDAAGLTVLDAKPEINIHAEGAGCLIGLDSGDIAYTGNFKTNTRIAYRGRLLATVQRNTLVGEIRIIATSPGLAAAEYLSNKK